MNSRMVLLTEGMIPVRISTLNFTFCKNFCDFIHKHLLAKIKRGKMKCKYNGVPL